MRLSKVSRIFLISILLPGLAFGSPEELNYQLKWNFTPQALKVGDVEGVWFPTQDAEFLLRLRTDTVPLLDQQVDELKLKIDELNAIVAKQAEARTNLEAQFTTANEERMKCTEKLVEALKPTPWFESPWFWGAVGVLVGGTVGVYLGTKR